MEKTLQEALGKSETLLWSGRPESFETLDKTHKKPFQKKTIITACIVIALCVAWAIYIAKTGGPSRWAIYVIIIACGGYGILSTILDANKIRKNVLYAVTDKRLIAVLGESTVGVPFAQIHECKMAVDEDGHTSFLGGEDALKAKPTKVRALCAVGPRAQDGVCDACVFYAIPEPDLFREAVGANLPL